MSRVRRDMLDPPTVIPSTYSVIPSEVEESSRVSNVLRSTRSFDSGSASAQDDGEERRSQGSAPSRRKSGGERRAAPGEETQRKNVLLTLVVPPVCVESSPLPSIHSHLTTRPSTSLDRSRHLPVVGEDPPR